MLIQIALIQHTECTSLLQLLEIGFASSTALFKTGREKNSLQIFFIEDVPLVEFMYLVFTGMPGESYCRRLRSLLLYLWYVFRALINSLVC